MDARTDQAGPRGFRRKIGIIARAAQESLPWPSSLLAAGVGLIFVAAGLRSAGASEGPWQAAGILLVAAAMAFAFWVHARIVLVARRQDRRVRREMEDLSRKLDSAQRSERDSG
jgi:Flp pilus assembly protein TadB